ncbi:ruBisCO large subunit-binding protein subunit alpha, chloroplastic-like [Gossypium australe]|uniref:RuBisCO large subunit-binding protein subunit alpha, chloroplastic-like n=1 Tax=Gossypium australe TaxID=47621 RepID=A0A5B6VAB6_9ROSI|nr:ruBisCO large subunit-binding protein subunit alpha, chloroplastic-like [Gossypium australe]
MLQLGIQTKIVESNTRVLKLKSFHSRLSELPEKDRYQNTRSSNTTARRRPPRNAGNVSNRKGETKGSAMLSEARAPARAYAIRAREDTSSPDVITENLMLLSFDEFDVILGMDWLMLHDGVVNCRQKTIELKCQISEILLIESDE